MLSENIKVSEVSDILRKQLEGIDTRVQLDEIGTVLQDVYKRQIPFICTHPEKALYGAIRTISSYRFRFGKEKINIIRSMDLLVIDEIRCV